MLNDRCAPGGGGGNGAARWIIWMAARSNSAEPELRRIDTALRPPLEAMRNVTTAGAPTSLILGLRTRWMRRTTCPG